MATAAPLVVPAIPPRPPQLSLVGSSVRPDGVTDPATFEIPVDLYSQLPSELKAELAARKGEPWVRGFAYGPENHGSGWLRDRCDGTTYDYKALPTPSGLAVNNVASGGTIPAGTHGYAVTAVAGNGETTATSYVTVVNALNDANVLTWYDTADGITYRVYGRVAGLYGLLATVGPFTEGTTPTWTDTGSASPGVAPPVSNTTGGSGGYSNPAIISHVPYVVEVMDTCSAFGWEARDFVGRASRWLENAKYAAIENEFWTGALAQAKGYPNDYLNNATTNTDLTPGTPPSVARGLQILQDALQQCGFGGQGMIHAQAQTVGNLLNVRRQGNLMLDLFDNIVIPGSGYPGTGPGGVAPGTGYAYIYATDLVMTRDSDVFVFPDTLAEAFDRGEAGSPNTITFRAEKFAAAYFDGACHFSCKVALAT